MKTFSDFFLTVVGFFSSVRAAVQIMDAKEAMRLNSLLTP